MLTRHDLFWGVAASDARHVWVAGSGGDILATRDGDASWSPQRPPSARQLGAVACSDARHVVAAGIAPGGVFVLVTRDGGRHWYSSPLMKSPGDLEGIASPDAQHIWAVGGPSLRADAPGAIIASRDGGATWTVQRSDPHVDYRGVAFSDARSGWAVGYGDAKAKGSGSVIAHTTDGGATWTQLQLSGVDGLLSVTCSDAQHAWAVGDAFDGSSAAIASTRDGGKTWSVRTLRLAAGDPQRLSLMAVTCSDASHLWVVGATRHAGVVLASSDGGATWMLQSMRPEMALLRAVTSAQGH